MARRIEQIKRNRKIRKTKKYILFEFEGRNKTEEIYFKNFQSRNNEFNIKFAYGYDTDPVGMVKSLIDYIEKEGVGLETEDRVYCVFDADIDLNKQKRINEAIKLALEHSIQPIISIPSFEIWYRLHYSYTSKLYNSNKELLKDLKKFIPDYEKNKNIFNILKDKVDNAVKNCKKLEEEQIKNGKDIMSITCNPYTSVYKPVEYLINNTKINGA